MLQLPTDKYLALRVIPMPADANANGDIFGGWIMSQVDLAGSIPAVRRAKSRIATVAVAADLGHDLLWVRANGRIFGPTSLSVPDEPAWAAPFPPLGLSPEGATAAG